MAELKCGVENCVYNEEAYCCKGEITVGGTHACRCSDTCCESFSESRREGMRSALEHPSRTISIDCEAVNCAYNQDYKCRADHVDIRGLGAKQNRDTACATFEEKEA